MKSKGFTLIELMIVVAIIAIIAAIAIPNLLRSRMAANEGSAIGACKAYAEAQDIYRRTDWDKDGVLEYSQSIGASVPALGTASLFYANATTVISLVDLSYARAEGDPTLAQPKAGYCFSVLTGQGNVGGSGTKCYVVAAPGTTTPLVNMTFGYALSAIPGQYDVTGRNTFQINNTGTTYQQDRGSTATGHLTTYNPDTTWAVAE